MLHYCGIWIDQFWYGLWKKDKKLPGDKRFNRLKIDEIISLFPWIWAITSPWTDINSRCRRETFNHWLVRNGLKTKHPASLECLTHTRSPTHRHTHTLSKETANRPLVHRQVLCRTRPDWWGSFKSAWHFLDWKKQCFLIGVEKPFIHAPRHKKKESKRKIWRKPEKEETWIKMRLRDRSFYGFAFDAIKRAVSLSSHKCDSPGSARMAFVHVDRCSSFP